MTATRQVTRLGARWRYFRGRGLLAAVHAILARGYRSQRFVVTSLDFAGPPAADHLEDIAFRLATLSDLDHLDEFERYGRGSRQRAYVKEDKDWLFVACHGDRIVATRRFSRALPPASRDGHGLMSRVVQLGPGQVWAADVFCLPEYRNYRHQSIGRDLGLFAMRFLAALGYTGQLSAVNVTNTASLRNSHRKGSQRLYYVSYVRLLFYERLVVSKDIPAAFRTPEGRDERADERGRPGDSSR